MILVALILLIASASACDLTTLTACVTSSLIPGQPDACSCWSTFLNYYKEPSSNCDYTSFSAALILVKDKCSTASASSFTPTSCTDAILAYQLCLTTVIGTSSSACDCWSKLQSSNLCTNTEQQFTTLALCPAAKALCDSIECDCSVLNQLLPDTETSLETCITNSAGDTCACYTTAVSQLTDITSDCDVAAEFDLKACIQSQLNCPTMISTNKCEATTVSLSVSDIDSIFTKAKDSFVNTWNTALSADSIVVSTVQHTLNGADQIVFTLQVTYDETKQTIQQVLDALKKEFSVTIGLSIDKLSAEASAGAKRTALTTSTTVTMTGTNAGSNTPGGASALSFVMIPLITLLGVFHYFF